MGFHVFVYAHMYSSEYLIQMFMTTASDLSLLLETKRGVAVEKGQKRRNSKLAK